MDVFARPAGPREAARFARPRPLAAVCVAVLLAGCAATPLPALPPSDIPKAWRNGEPGADWPPLEWWRAFGSDELTALVGQVRERNF